jgi:LPXTG-motif cell wall-anchored protein
MTVLGASALLVAGLMGSPAVAFATPTDTEKYLPDAQVCEDYDSGKKDVNGDRAEVPVEAPEGKLISGYCVKAGSKNQEGDGGVYVVTLAKPTDQVTITYPWGGGRDVSHYALMYVDITTKPTPEPSPTVPGEEPTEPGEEPTEPGEEPTQPGEEPTEPGEEPTVPGEEPTQPGEEPTVPGVEPTVPGEEPTDGSVAPVDGDVTPSPSPSAATDGPGELAATGASTAIGFTLIALALVGGGVTLIVLRRKGVLGS